MSAAATPVFAPRLRRAGPLLYLAVCSVVCVAVAAVVGVSPAQAADGVQTIDHITYTVSGGEATITGTDETITSPITIPAAILGGTVAVVAIGPNAFQKATGLGAVTIPDSIRSIGFRAFMRLNGTSTGVTSLALGQGVETLGTSAFENNEITGTLSIPGSVTTMGDRVFSGNSIDTLTLTSGLTKAGSDAFAKNNLSTVFLPSTLTNLGNGAFQGNNLTSITVPATLTTLGYGVFGSGLTSVLFAEGTTAVPEHAFSNYRGASEVPVLSVTFPASLRTIGADAFAGANIPSVTLPAGIVSIGDNAFAGVTDMFEYTYSEVLASVTLKGAAPTTVGTTAFGTLASDGNDSKAIIHYPTTFPLDAEWNGYTTASYSATIASSSTSATSATVTPGSLTAALSAVNFPESAFTHAAHTTTIPGTLAVDDQTGLLSGWGVTMSASDLVWSSPGGSASSIRNIEGGALSVVAGGSVTTLSGDALASSALGDLTALGSAKRILTAPVGDGSGSYTVPLTFSLAIPANAAAGSYTGTLTTTISAAP